MKIFLLLTVLAISTQARFYNHVSYGDGPPNPDFKFTNDTLPQAHSVSQNIMPGQEVYNGWITVNEEDGSKLYYEIYSAKTANESQLNQTKPLIIWLNGGPGCSSQLGMLTEIGPWQVDEDGSCAEMPVHWNVDYHLMFIDQPVGVGWSPQGNKTLVSSAAEAGEHFYTFLTTWYSLPEFSQFNDYPLYIAGESFGGSYIPTFASIIVENNGSTPLPLRGRPFHYFLSSSHTLPLGVMIGDGWTDAPNQLTYNQYAYVNGFADKKTQLEMQKQEGIVLQNIEAGNFYNATQQWDPIPGDLCKRMGNCNVYNFRQYDVDPLNEPFKDWINKAQTKQMFGIPSEWVFNSCNMAIYNAFYNDIMQTKVAKVEYLLDNIKVMLYNGQDDFIVNTQGAMRWISRMNWSGLADWKKAKKQTWKVKGTDFRVGTAQMHGNLWWAVVYKAGHMVPTDAPESAKDMIDRFIADDMEWES